mgnify:FL=1
MQFLLKNEGLTPLKEKEFRKYIVARFLYIMALRMVATVVAYRLFQITQSSFAIGLVGLAEFIPVFSLALYAGHVIDTSDKRTLLLKGMLTYALCVVGLIVITSDFLIKDLSITTQEYFFYFIILFKSNSGQYI